MSVSGGYYESVIRDAAGLARIRDYISINSARWVEREYHPPLNHNP